MNNFEVVDPIEFEQAKTELSRKAKKEHTQSPGEGLANRTIHYYYRTDDPNKSGGEKPRPTIIHEKYRLHPGENDVGGYSSEIITQDELPEFDKQVLKRRMNNTGTPFVNESSIRFRRPETNLASMNDYHFFDESVINLIQGPHGNVNNIDMRTVANDIKAMENEPKVALHKGTQKGITGVREYKGEISENKREMIRLAKNILQAAGEYTHNDQQALKQMSPRKLFHFVDQTIDQWLDGRDVGQEKARKMFDSIDTLQKQARALEKKREGIENESIDVFQDTLSHDGFIMPSDIQDPDDAISEYGIGTREYLGV